MNEVLLFTIVGLCSGSLYALAALGLVLIHRSSGVVNFAHGATGMAGTFLWWELRELHQLPFALAAAAGIAMSALIGVATYYLVMRPLATASTTTKVIASLAMMVVLQSAAGLRYRAETIAVPPFLPTGHVPVAGAAVGRDQLLVLAIVCVLVVLLWLVYRHTRFGLATSAVAEKPRLSSTLGISPHAVAGTNWAIAAALAALAGIMLAPITGLQITALTLLVIPALAASVLGRLVSFPLTLLGGLIIGVSQAQVARFADLPGAGAVVPFLLIVGVLVWRGAAMPGRETTTARLPGVGSGRVQPITLLALLLLTGLVTVSVLGLDWIDAVNVQLSVAIILLSIVVVTGYAGQLSLAQYTFAGLGGLVAGRLVVDLGWGFEAAILAGVIALLPVGLVVGWIGLRTRGVDLAVLTLLLAVAIDSAVFANRLLVGSSYGTQVGPQTFLGVNVDTILAPERYTVLLLIVLALVGVLVANLRRGRVGRQLIAVRSNERAATALGIPVRRVRLYAFALSAMIAGLGGILLAFRNPVINFSDFDVFASIYLVQEAVVGGVGWLAGPALGASLHPGALGSAVFAGLLPEGDRYLPLIGGLLLLLTLIAAPHGLAAVNAHAIAKIRDRLPKRAREKSRTAPVSEDSVASPPRVRERALAVRDLTVRFGGVTAVDGVSLDVAPGEVVGLIGPNGAGKSTVIDAATGFVSTTTGQVLVGDTDLCALTGDRRLRAGLGRSFQSVELFDDLTVLDNLRVAVEDRSIRRYLTDLVRPGAPRTPPAIVDVVRELGLGPELDLAPDTLSYGRRRVVAIARAIVAAPSVLLLDEPAAGLADDETARLGELIRKLASERGMAVLLVEHDVELVMNLCDRIYVLDAGKVIATGTAAQVRADQRVIEAYLGAPEQAAGVETGATTTR